MLYLASLAALQEMATAYGNMTLVARCTASRRTALATVDRLLWTGTHYRGFACDALGPGQVNDANIQGDSLYGVLWASLLGLDTGLAPERLRQHAARGGSDARDWTLCLVAVDPMLRHALARAMLRTPPRQVVPADRPSLANV